MASTNRKHNRNRTKSPAMQRYKAENRLAKNKARREETRIRRLKKLRERQLERIAAGRSV